MAYFVPRRVGHGPGLLGIFVLLSLSLSCRRPTCQTGKTSQTGKLVELKLEGGVSEASFLEVCDYAFRARGAQIFDRTTTPLVLPK